MATKEERQEARRKANLKKSARQQKTPYSTDPDVRREQRRREATKKAARTAKIKGAREERFGKYAGATKGVAEAEVEAKRPPYGQERMAKVKTTQTKSLREAFNDSRKLGKTTFRWRGKTYQNVPKRGIVEVKKKKKKAPPSKTGPFRSGRRV